LERTGNMPKRKLKKFQHPIDATGVLEAAKNGRWKEFYTHLNNPSVPLTADNFNELPPGRTFGVLHQIAYHRHLPALTRLLLAHPRVDLKLPTKDGQTALEVAEERAGANSATKNSAFLLTLRERQEVQTHHELVSKARDGEWSEFFEQLESETLSIETINAVPPGRTWGILHQICYWGDTGILEQLLTAYPDLDLEQETKEDAAAQLPTDIAIGRGHTDFVTALRAKLEQQKPTSLVTAPSSAMKIPVSAAGKLCTICYVDEHEAGALAVSCDNDHYMCETCFSGWVESESDIEANPQSILLNGGRITCPCKKSDGCDSLAYANKLIAMVVQDELYEKYLRARDFVVGKEAVAGALSKIKDAPGSMNAVEEEQIRNMYRAADGSYSAYMCGACKFGPIDHGWCGCLSSHHGDEKDDGGSINNSCPKCNWFVDTISEWPRWDGQFR